MKLSRNYPDCTEFNPDKLSLLSVILILNVFIWLIFSCFRNLSETGYSSKVLLK
uniref:Uncharacterized protein n=1 Tax=uncultured Desulfobacterium sp. TaxID=201089 RepID=E1YHS8_9BACT|nr:unknown protein [uncultured Desulfobacterium sp.]